MQYLIQAEVKNEVKALISADKSVYDYKKINYPLHSSLKQYHTFLAMRILSM